MVTIYATLRLFFASYRSGTAGTSHIPFSIAVSCQPPVISSELFFIMYSIVVLHRPNN